MPRPQFRLSTLLWITLAVACFYGGAEWQRKRTQRDRKPIANPTLTGPIIIKGPAPSFLEFRPFASEANMEPEIRAVPRTP
jgi:hypothetical protein